MGWTFTHRERGTTDLDWFRRQFGTGYELIDGMTVGRTFYGAVRDEDGKVSAAVILINRNRGEFNFGYKDMTEAMGPGEARCPERILDQLTPTDSEYANEWRARCREHNARQAKVKVGTRIRLNTNHGEEVFEVARLGKNLFYPVHDGHTNTFALTRIPWWRSSNFEVVS